MDKLNDPRALRDGIEAEARRLHFDLFGVTTPEPPPHLPVFQRWLGAGRHGEMAYLAGERSLRRRADPREILPECRSILALGIRYPRPADPAPGATDGLRGRMAAYALGDDYHDVLAERLESLAAFIGEMAGAPVANRYYTDSGPVLERDLAQRAGLGWIGKNTCLISPQGGSYFLLAEMLLGIELPPDEPFGADRCGSCTRCLEACPTGCILPDRTLDARRCISYLTIELKGPIPAELRPHIGDWIFGCDICQQVCPWNARAGRREPCAPEAAFLPRSGAARPELAAELTLTPENFNRKFKGSPVRRARRRGYLRNVALALGNLKDRSAVSSLSQALRGDSEPLVRGAAAWSLGRLGGDVARRSLTVALEQESDAIVREEIRQALAIVEMA